nr:MAG TPA: hypothetical protein [Caudoviricetes sp.]
MYFRRLRAECFCFSCRLVAHAAKSFLCSIKNFSILD